MFLGGGITLDEKEMSGTESLLSMIIDQTFAKHKVDTKSVALTTEERRKLLETVRILQNQAETFLKKPVIKKYSESSNGNGNGNGAQKYMPKNKHKI